MRRLPDIDIVLDGVLPAVELGGVASGVVRLGKVVDVGPTLIKAKVDGCGLGELCLIDDSVLAEVVALQNGFACLSPFSEPRGMRCGVPVLPTGDCLKIAVGDHLVGTVVDGLGRSLVTDVIPSNVEWRPIECPAPDPLGRKIIHEALPLGVRAIDATLTCGRGQRVGIFAAAGGGKSTLLSMICDGNLADVIVLALVGERGREVREFLDLTLSTEAKARSVVVVSTSDRPALERVKSVYTATTIAEYFRDQGKDVLLMVDSLTRYARAAREIAVAAGEPPAAGSYPASVFAGLPRVLERAGNGIVGSITGIYTVLVEGDNLKEPIADEVRSILDGHIVLSRKLGEANHYPAIDVAASVSRVMSMIATPRHRQLAGTLRLLLARYQEIELLIRVGEYERGNDPEADQALDRHSDITEFLRQSVDESCDFDDTLARLSRIVGDLC